MIRVTSSPLLKTQVRAGDQRRQLLMALRVYRHKALVDRFTYYVNDMGQPIYLLPSELKEGMVVNHDKGIRYTSLISFIKRTFKTVIENELMTKTRLNRELLKDRVNIAIATDFDLQFVDSLKQQLVTLEGSGYNPFSKFTVDQRAVDAVKKSTIPTEPTIDPLGQVELNDIDAGDLEMMIIDEDRTLREQAREIELRSLSTEVRYKRGLYNKENIFELFASIYFDDRFSSTYDKIVIRLFEYRHFSKPQEHSNYFNEKWIASFFTFLWTDGYTELNTKNFDPLKFDTEIFTNKNKANYEVDNFYKLFEILKTVSNVFIDDGLLSPINFKKIDLSKICNAKKSKKGKRRKDNLSNGEFNKLFFFNFRNRDLKQYQAVFSKKHDKSTIKINVSDLETARDMFCLQTMAGGLRGYRDLQTMKFNKTDKAISYYVSKVDDLMINPFNVYTEILAKDNSYKLPKLRFNNSENSLEHIYRALLKTMAEIIPFDREINKSNQIVKIKAIFNPYFARKTFIQILIDEYEISRQDIAMFTGHSVRGESVMETNYVDDQSPAKKKKVFDKLKLPRGFTKKSKRSFG
jgi:hypothetical protein